MTAIVFLIMLMDDRVAAKPCTPPQTQNQPATLKIPSRFFENAKKRAHLIKLLRESIYDISNGILNVQRELEIRKLMDEVRKGE